MSGKEEVLFGADPEIAVTNINTGALVAAWNVTEGTKDNHEKCAVTWEPRARLNTWLPPELDIHADGVALELNLPAQNRKNFAKATSQVFNWANHFLGLKGPYAMSRAPEMDGYAFSELMHPLARLSGCDPDYCAYDDEPEKPRKLGFDPMSTPKRFFGGHIHVGFNKSLLNGVEDYVIIRCIDATSYMQAIHRDHQDERRKHYGKAGLFRPKSYGIEYRTPSNFWLGGSAFLDCFSYNTSMIIQLLRDDPKKVNDWYNVVPWKDVKNCIDEEKETEAFKLWLEIANMFHEKTGNSLYQME